MKAGEKLSLEHIQAFLTGSEEIHFEAKGQADLYEWIARTLREQGYKGLPKPGKGLVKRYISKMTGLGRAPEPLFQPLHQKRHRITGCGG